MNTYLYHLYRSTEKLHLVDFHCHIALARHGEAQEGFDLLATFIAERIDAPGLRFLNLNLMIFDDTDSSFDQLGTSISALSNLEFLMLTLPPFMEDAEGPSARAKAFIMMVLESVSSHQLEAIFFMVGAVSQVKALAVFDWTAVGKALRRPNYANLISVGLDCMGNMTANEWAEEAIPWLNAHVRNHIPPHIALNISGIGPAGLITINPAKSISGLETISTKARAFCNTLISYIPF
ncbi:hypothetical protein DL96DRAFT_1559999 [Flagelloscypha sp. PMI_526]|nr:hypothetical protein DL96DRAFT_1559999 [Flagelloscypha sp. PMI_526]